MGESKALIFLKKEAKEIKGIHSLIVTRTVWLLHKENMSRLAAKEFRELLCAAPAS